MIESFFLLFFKQTRLLNDRDCPIQAFVINEFEFLYLHCQNIWKFRNLIRYTGYRTLLKRNTFRPDEKDSQEVQDCDATFNELHKCETFGSNKRLYLK